MYPLPMIIANDCSLVVYSILDFNAFFHIIYGRSYFNLSTFQRLVTCGQCLSCTLILLLSYLLVLFVVHNLHMLLVSSYIDSLVTGFIPFSLSLAAFQNTNCFFLASGMTMPLVTISAFVTWAANLESKVLQ